MSVVRKIIDAKGKTDLKKLKPMLDEYDAKLLGWEDNLTINSKTLQKTLIEHHSWAAYYDQIKVELWTVVKHFDIELAEIAGTIYDDIRENAKLDHTETGLKRMIAKHPKFVAMSRVKLEIEELHDKADSIAKQFYQRAFTLRNYLKMIELNAEDVTITFDL